jgi:hypothetical protein
MCLRGKQKVLFRFQTRGRQGKESMNVIGRGDSTDLGMAALQSIHRDDSEQL